MNASLIKSRGIVAISVIGGLIALGAILTGAKVHGFSFAAWHSVIDRSPCNEVFFNKVNRYRSDDWMVMLPHMLAQRADSPPFAAENRLIGDGHYNMTITVAAPARDLTVLFRPQVWGYFISGDVGMAFQWWFYALGAWMAVWLVLRRLTDNDELTSACGATALLFSPFFQAWSLNCTPSVIFACGALLALVRLSSAGSPWQLLLSTAMLVWFGIAFLLTFNYFPYLVVLLYGIFFVFFGMALTRNGNAASVNSSHVQGQPGEMRPPSRAAAAALPQIFRWPRAIRWTCALLALLCILGSMAYVTYSNADTIALIRHSDYPGRRLSTGGDQTIAHLFRGNVISIKPPVAWCEFNPCEGPAFFLVFPLVFAAMLRDWWRTRKRPNALLLGIAGYIAFLLIWNLIGFAKPLAHWTLMERAPPFRTLIGLGIADLLLLAAYVGHRRRLPPASRQDYITPWIAGTLWIMGHVALAFKVSGHFPDYSIGMALGAGLLAMAMAPLFYLAPRLVIPAIMIASIVCTYDINPLARGGAEFIQENPLSQKIKSIDQEEQQQGHQPIWLAYGGAALPNLFRMIGAHALNGVHAYTQAGLWRKLDPEGQARTAYNRYAHVVFAASSEPADFKINLTHNDQVAVNLHPDNPRFAALNVDYVLCTDNQIEVLDRATKLERIYSYAGKHIYRVARDRTGGQP